ncbi:MAG: hypothetical protein ACI38O_03820 [Fibrobacter intestinalis]|uniref:hypothetical protein n=1 Tax=Fibrobacter intestinalis TaxID=28122 RepID=UPI003EFD0698
MKSSELFALEHSNKSEIHLFLAGNFWQAWEKSAFFFFHRFAQYQVHCRYVKKIQAEMLYLGFPQSALPVLQEKAKGEGWNWTVVDERHIVVAGFVPQTGFEDWKSQRFRKDAEKGVPDSPEKAKPLWVPHDNLLLSLKEFYECTKYVFTRTGEASRLYRYGLGDKLRGECLDFLDILQCAVQKASAFDGSAAYRFYCRIRIKLRLLMDFRQLSEKQWFFINERLEKIQKSLRLESFGLRSTGVSPIESGDPLPAIGNEVLSN